MSKDKEYKERLRRIVLYSADILPKEVSSYLLSNYHYFDAEKDILKKFHNYKPLVDYIPHQFVEFALDYLIKKPSVKIDYKLIYLNLSFSGVREEGWSNKLGISGDYNFIPAAPIQGPFLYLLNQNEEEGLRLVHTLVNVAIERWRHQPQIVHPDRPDLIPVPVTLQLASGPHDFWGNFQVYSWFRAKSVEPNLVMSALMALEVWMETQIEAARNAEELFEKILVKSDCVAVPGICLGIALAYPEKCLKAALPIVSSPMIWNMDISRYVLDLSGTFSFDPLETNKLIYDWLEERDKRPQRSREIRNIAVRYMLSGDDNIISLFQQATKDFDKNLPFFTKGDQEDPKMIAYLKEDVKKFQIYGDLKNYKQRQAGNYVEIIVEPPEEIKKRNEEFLALNVEWGRLFGVYLWAEKTITDGRPQERMTLEEAVAAAKELQTSEDFTQLDQEDIPGVTPLQAIVGVAAAILIADFEWARTQNHLEWCRAILLAAARMAEASMYTRSPSSVKVYAGRGLALLATHGVVDIEVRQQILQLISESLKRFPHQGEVVKAAFGGLQNAWTVDPVLCWNALSLCLSLSVIPGKLDYGTPVGQFGTSYEELETWEENVIQNHFEYLAKEEIPELPRITTARNIAFLHEQAQYALYALPLTELCRDSDTKDKLLQLCDDLVHRTIVDNLPVEGKAFSQSDKSYSWNPFIFNWAACLAKSLSIEETRHHILTPLRDNWSQVRELTPDLLDGYISHHIADVEVPTAQALEIWKEICNWVLDSPEIARKVSCEYLDRETGAVLQLIVFTQHGSSRIKDDWQHAHLFIDIFDKWVSVAGHNPYTYRHLLTMLNGIGWQFAPEPIVEWLNRCASNAIHNLWDEKGGNGRRTAELLNRIWNNFEPKILRNKVTLQRYSNLVYQLVEAGIPLASVLQKKLEGRG
ncbi:hypothetical protein BJP36_22000 [Moorena producens JHB]|uniref:Uncharacterized protein n=1 Tax=Moorena producens (strain JHB) TaxID=1454205 RepID=A0A1D9G456_MOOP1|nr:hypothetical protein [Moorena producens]AOY82180.1 hypothetical protein BJP36_22000 [Moorena producens JHB]